MQGRCLGRQGSDLAIFHHVEKAEKVDCFCFYIKRHKKSNLFLPKIRGLYCQECKKKT